MNFIYSKTFMLKSQNLEISKICPNEIRCLEIEIININLPPEFLSDNHGHQSRKNKWDKDKHFKTKTVINSLPPDIKRITAILNKITDDNYDKMVEEAKTFNYADPEVVTVIFKKILAEPFFSETYANFCNSLENLHDIINERCIIEFNKTKHKNLGIFIGELYKLNLLNDLDSFLKVLLDDIDEAKLETLCKIIITIGIKNKKFVNIIAKLDSIKAKFGSRHKFMIMDIVEAKIPKN